MAAMPCPPPIHIVTSAYRPPVRCSSYSALTVRMEPVAPIGWPSEMPLPFGLVRSAGQAQLAHDRECLRSERLVDLEHVDVLDLEAGPLQHRTHRRHRADAHDPRLHAGVAVGHQPAHGLPAVRVGVVGVGISTTAAAASLMPAALPAVTVPSGSNTGFSLASSSNA